MGLNLFISYSHEDEKHIEKFIKHIAPLKEKGVINEWYDRKIVAGEDWKNSINNNFDNADIICFFISSNFLSSTSCKAEKNEIQNLKLKKGITTIAIILSPCGWLDDDDLSKFLALPNDGKPITKYSLEDDGWMNVYEGLKKAISEELFIRTINISDSFSVFLNDADLLTKAHFRKEKLLLDDIYIYPDFTKYSDLKEFRENVGGEKIIDDILLSSKILLAGEDQSGKSTFCKVLYKELRKKGFLPVYISDKNFTLEGIIENKIIEAFYDQYSIKYSDIKTRITEETLKEKIFPIIDDFHFAKKKEKHIQYLSNYSHYLLVVDDIFSLNFQDENLIRDFTQYKIKQLSPTLRNTLIKNWITLDDKNSHEKYNHIYKDLDIATEIVNTTLGKIFNSGIMPAYPFFILSVLSSYESLQKPIDQEITSQGYCYQFLIYKYLGKQGVKPNEIDTYINFLSVIAYTYYKDNKQELSDLEFENFMNDYLESYNLPIKKEILLRTLNDTKILIKSSCNNYYFYYPYLYYYFVAKYLSEHLEENKMEIKKIINNLHIDEYAYITIFLSHHSKNDLILDELIINSSGLFKNFKPATLKRDELKFFDNKLDSIINAVLPPSNHSAELERRRRLHEQDVIEESQVNIKNPKKHAESEDDEIVKELRRSIKTVDVMGRIIKNRSGSLEKKKLEQIFEYAMNIHLRLLSSFFSIIQNDESQANIENYLFKKLEIIISAKNQELSQDQIIVLAKRIFWNLNFSTIYGFINKIIDLYYDGINLTAG